MAINFIYNIFAEGALLRVSAIHERSERIEESLEKGIAHIEQTIMIKSIKNKTLS